MEAILEVTHAGCYTSRLSVEHAVRISVLSGHATPEGSVGLWELAGPDEALAPAFRDLASHPNIRRAEVLQKRAGAWILETLDMEAEVSNALIRAGLVFLPPVIIAGGTETYRVFAVDRKQIDAAVKALTPKNEVRIVALRERVSGVGALASLSDKQREALALAVREGYYERPRRTDLDALAKALGVSRPSLSERLQRAEAHVMRALFET
jgi:predicted DNA binding protein